MVSRIKFTKLDLQNCFSTVKPFVARTPVMTSRSLNRETEANLFFKCENFQRAGSFKIRGASHAIANLSDEKKSRGIVAHSSGNFAQAVSLAASGFGIPACIAMPSTAPKIKVAATVAYGGEIVNCQPTAEARERQAELLVAERNATFIHPSNDIDVILGHSTVAIELLDEQPNLDYVLTPIGGGGLIAGCSLAVKFFGKHCKTIGAEPFTVDDAYRSLSSGQIEFNESTETIADGLRTFLGNNNFPIIQQNVDRIIRVTESEIVDAMKLIWNRMKIVVEPSSAVAFAAVLREPDFFQSKSVGIVLTGGNVDLENLPF